MRVEQLYYIFEIASAGSIHQAAERLGLSPQNLSAYLKNLETELDVQLFTRNAKGASLTEDGRALMPYFEKIWEQWNEVMVYSNKKCLLNESARNFCEGELRFACSVIIARFLVPKVITAFSKEYPNINLVITEVSSDLLKQDVFEGDCDVILHQISVDDLKNYVSPEAYDMEPVIQDTLVAVCNKHSDFATRRSISLSVLSKQSLVFFSIEPIEKIWAFRKAFLEHGLRPKNITQINIESMFFNMIKNNTLTLYSKLAIRKSDYQEHYGLTNIPLKEKVDFYYLLFTKRSEKQETYVQYFIDCVKDVLFDYS